MTNTRITDPEVLERRYPVILHAFSLRRGSGGAGQWPGGDGLVRAMEFREAVTVSCLMERRTTAAFGVQGGENGQPGQNWLLNDEGPIHLEGHATFQVEAGDIIIIETPGGGGWEGRMVMCGSDAYISSFVLHPSIHLRDEILFADGRTYVAVVDDAGFQFYRLGREILVGHHAQ